MKQPRPLGIAAAVLAVLVTAGLAGCVGQQSGTVAVYVTGSPSTEYERVFVTVTKVEVHTSSDDDFDPQPYEDPDQPPSPPANQTPETTLPDQNNTTSPGNNSTQGTTTPPMDSNNTTAPPHNQTSEDDNDTLPDDFGGDAGWQTVVDEPSGITVEVTGTAGVRTLLGHADIPDGHYTQIRLEVIEAWGEDASGNRTVFDVPSGELKTARSFDVSPNATAALTFEFDLDRSIVTAGESGKVIFKPVFAQVTVTYESEVESGAPTSPTEAPMPTTGLPGNETGNNTTATTGP